MDFVRQPRSHPVSVEVTMFTVLVESKAQHRRSARGTVFSLVAHYAIILLAIFTSARAATGADRPRQEQVAFVQPAEPERKPAPPPEVVVAPPVVRTAPVLVAPLEVPSVLPEIDLTHPRTNPDDFVPGRREPLADTGATGGRELTPGATYYVFQVEKPAMQAPNSAVPAYPDLLRRAGVEGEALVSFTVDSTGRADLATFKVIHTTHELFAASVKAALPRMRFIPAEVGDRRVAQLVQQAFSFALKGDGRPEL